MIMPIVSDTADTIEIRPTAIKIESKSIKEKDSLSYRVNDQQATKSQTVKLTKTIKCSTHLRILSPVF